MVFAALGAAGCQQPASKPTPQSAHSMLIKPAEYRRLSPAARHMAERRARLLEHGREVARDNQARAQAQPEAQSQAQVSVQPPSLTGQ
jgi:hypothetical protein